MKDKWKVVLEGPVRGTWPQGYFPRTFYYRREAVKLVRKVEEAGGSARIERASKEAE